MNRNAPIVGLLVLTLAALSGCSSKPPANESKKANIALQKIQGKVQILVEPATAAEASLNAGGPSVYLWEGPTRYRLFLRTATELFHGDEYIAEGVYAQKAIDEIGDPDQGKNGYPLQESCAHVVRMAWKGLSFDVYDAQTEALRTRVKRYPARPVFLVTRIQPVAPKDGAASAKPKKDAAAADDKIPTVSVPADKQRALLLEGSAVQTAPLWEPAAGTVSCKVIIGKDGKISELETGAQLCEVVPWVQFRYQPTLRKGQPVKVETEVEVRFEPRK